jgi:hypothetical protein
MVFYNFPGLFKFVVHILTRPFFGLNQHLVRHKKFCVQIMILATTGNIIIVFNDIVNNRGSQNLDTSTS